MDYKEMKERINKVINDFLFPLEKHENDVINLIATSILLRGFVTCNNDNVEKSSFLLTGINPSFNRGAEYFPKGLYEKQDYTFLKATSQAKPREFWYKKKEQFGSLCSIMAYLDLFPIREADQRIFNQTFDPFNEFMGKILAITQDAIEEMHPQLIVHANKGSMRYWGKNQGDWMGYIFEPVDPVTFDERVKGIITPERLQVFPIYKITGLSNHPERINKDIYAHNTALKGCFFMEYVMEYRKKKDRQKMYSAKEWEVIWSWVKEHTNSPEK